MERTSVSPSPPLPSPLLQYTSTLSSFTTLSSLHTRMTTSSEQSEFVSWAWEVVLMLKLHPNQVLVRSTQTLSPSNSNTESESTLHSGRRRFNSSTCSSGGSAVHSRSHDWGADAAASPSKQRRNTYQPPGNHRTRETCLTGSACLEHLDEATRRIPSAKDARVYQETGLEWNLGGTCTCTCHVCRHP